MTQPPLSPDPDFMLDLVHTRMPFGRYAGRRLIDLPEPYLVWFAGRGFPEGRLGRMLQSVYEIKVNGLEHLLEPLRDVKKES
ncbi:MAG: DUF3820 family protein [Geoalkalibacter sp.]|jgi:uncharacterized protein (DUF3820 family)|uniref:DUF3820 family protein n=1 Tax=Geoalkalibacter sp. TaxID=3041440 RepID=UPI002A9A5CE4|nr:DUF3820 family protein [Thermodesulfobacteriota bacterium]